MFKLLGPYLKVYRKEVIIGPIFKWIEAIFELIVPLVMADMIDVGIKNGDVSYVFSRGGVMLLLGVVGLGCSLVCQRLASLASQGAGTLLRRDLFKKISTFSHQDLDRFGPSTLLTRITGDANQMQVAVAMLIRLVVRSPFLVVGAIVMSFFVNPTLSLVFLAVSPLVAAVLWLVMTKSVPLYKGIAKRLDQVGLITRENLTGARVVRAFARQKDEKERFARSADQLTAAALRVGRLSALLNPLNFAILNGGVAAIVYMGGLQVNSGLATTGEIIALVNYMTQISIAMVAVANLVVIFTKATACASRITEVMETQPSIVFDPGSDAQPDFSAAAVEFENVSFAYPGASADVLSGVSFSARVGETVGVIGGTGSGKTTLINLIPRFYDVTGGNLRLFGRPVREYSQEGLARLVGVSPQKAVLFSGTVRSNVAMGAPGATDSELAQAIEVAQGQFIYQKGGLEAPVSQQGKNLSGGQKQRLAIARALAGSPPILILDDSLSALDLATDAALRKALRESCKGTLVFMVTQRAASIRHADKIIVLDDGRVAGIGPHDLLMERCPEYRELVRSQQGGAA